MRPAAPHIAILIAVSGAEHMNLFIPFAQKEGGWGGGGGCQRMSSGRSANCDSGIPLAWFCLQFAGIWLGRHVLCARRIQQRKWKKKWNGRLGKGGAVKFSIENVEGVLDGFRIVDC